MKMSVYAPADDRISVTRSQFTATRPGWPPRLKVKNLAIAKFSAGRGYALGVNKR
jgi:hypothetical protein